MTTTQWTPKLWFGQETVDALKQRVRDGEPTAVAIKNIAEDHCQGDDAPRYHEERGPKGLPKLEDGENFMVACGLNCLLSDDAHEAAAYAQRALKAWTFFTSDGLPSDLGVGRWCVLGATLIESIGAHLSSEEQQFLLNSVLRLVEKLHVDQSGGGNPHNVTNNWWSICHGGALIGALAVHGRPNAQGGVRDCSEVIHWARQRLLAFCCHFGDAGIYHEGLGYQNYAMSTLLPAMVASAREGFDFIQSFPCFQNTAATMYASVVQREAMSDGFDDRAGFGAQLSWNDAGPSYGGGPWESLSIHLAHPHQRGALRWVFDRIHGIHGSADFGSTFEGWWWTAFFYPYEDTAVDPEGVLPRFVVDSRQGIGFVRSAWDGPDAATFGILARATHVGGHAQDDAASMRFIALGHDWIIGGGQARGKAPWQSVVTDSTGERSKPLPCAALLWREATQRGAVFGIDCRRSHGAYSERWVSVDYSAETGYPAVLAVLDQIDDHRDDRHWIWNLAHEPGLTVELHNNTALLRAEDGAWMLVAFVGVEPSSITTDAMPESNRTFSNGQKRSYPGRPLLHASYAAQPHLGMYTVMVVGRGEVPTVSANGLDIAINGATWARPFGPALAADFTPGVSHGSSKWPGGKVLE